MTGPLKLFACCECSRTFILNALPPPLLLLLLLMLLLLLLLVVVVVAVVAVRRGDGLLFRVLTAVGSGDVDVETAAAAVAVAVAVACDGLGKGEILGEVEESVDRGGTNALE